MKNLHLMRHAKSAWDNPGLGDRERTLNDRGRRSAARMGEALAAYLVEPPDLCVSPARRAQETLEGLCAAWPELARRQHSTEEELYTFDARELIAWIETRGGDRTSIFLLGHNPAFTELINTLTQRYTIDNLPTAGYVHLELDIEDWNEVRRGVATVKHVLLPRQLA